MSRLAPQQTSAVERQQHLFEADDYKVVGRLLAPPAEPAEVYRVLADIQAQLPLWQSLSIASNPALRVPGRTFKPDLLVLYGGRNAVIEIDGGSHYRRYCADRSRDRMLEDAGVAFVDRLSAEEACDRHEAERFVNRFLVRLRGR